MGLIACGRWGKNYVSTVNAMENVEITHVVTTHPENAKLFKNKVRVLKNYRELCTINGLDGAFLAAPSSFHNEIAQECLYGLLPIMIEKPMCIGYEQTLTLSKSIRGAKIPCLVNHTQLFNPAYQEICSLFKAGRPKKIISKFCTHGPFRPDCPMLWDYGVQDVSMILNLLKENPLEVNATLDAHKNYPNSGELVIDLRFKSTEAHIVINNIATKKYRSFITETGWNQMSMFDEELYEIRESGINRVHVPTEKPLARAIQAFIAAIEANEYVGVDLAVDVARVLERCQESINKNSGLTK